MVSHAKSVFVALEERLRRETADGGVLANEAADRATGA